MIRNITPTIRFIGVDDPELDLFESQYVVPEGMSYNSYLILDEKVAILDTADGRKGDAWKAHLAEALEGRTPDYLVVHHMEPDHSSLVAEMLEKYPSLTLVYMLLSLRKELFLWENILPTSNALISLRNGEYLGSQLRRSPIKMV